MKKAFVVSISLCVLLVVLTAGATAGPVAAVKIKIPFSFYAGDQLVPAGSYILEMPRSGRTAVGSLIRFTSEDGTICVNMLSQVEDAAAKDNDYHVIFTKYGEKYFLSKVSSSSYGAALPTSRSEKMVSAEYKKSLGTVASVEMVYTRSKAK